MASPAEQRFLELLRKPIKTKEDMIEKEKASAEFVKELRQETKGLLDELKAVGIEIESVYDLVNTKASYPEAIPILIRHVPKAYHERNKDGIIRALTVKEATGKANAVLIAEYHKTPKEKMNLRWVIGNAIYIIVTKADVESIIPIVQDKENGYTRDRFILALGKVKSEQAENVLIKLLDDEEVVVQSAIEALGRMKSTKARGKIEQLLTAPKKEIRKEAEKALKKIDRSSK